MIKKVSSGHSFAKDSIVVDLPEPAQSKFKQALISDKVSSARLVELLATFDITVGSDVMRRHRRRLLGKDGCKCPREH